MVWSLVGGRMVEALSPGPLPPTRPYVFCRSPATRKVRLNGLETPSHRTAIIRHIQEATGFRPFKPSARSSA